MAGPQKPGTVYEKEAEILFSPIIRADEPLKKQGLQTGPEDVMLFFMLQQT